MEHKTIEYQGSRLSYLKAGKGKKVLITLHGFGQQAKDFTFIELAYPQHQFFHINLFLHKSYLHPHHRPLTEDIWLEIFSEFLVKEKIESFSLAGFSMGCRLIYGISKKYADKIDFILLISPEGENLSGWYRISVSLLRGVFKYFVFHPALFFLLVNLLKQINILDSGVARFAKSQMKNRRKRWQVYMTWVNFRFLGLNIRLWINNINHYKIPVIMVVGEKDRLISAEKIIAFSTKLQRVTVFKIKSSHQDLIRRAGEYLAKQQR